MALAFLRIASIRLMLRKLCNPALSLRIHSKAFIPIPQIRDSLVHEIKDSSDILRQRYLTWYILPGIHSKFLHKPIENKGGQMKRIKEAI
jgi:hypothetical protein